jgi:hypothetical protein
MLISSVDFHKKLVGHLKNTNFTRIRMEELYSERKIVRRDIEQVYNGLFIDAVTSFEGYLERLFIGLLARKIVIRGLSKISKIHISSESTIREVINNGDRYSTWLPFSKTLEKANIYFVKGMPFSKLSGPDLETLNNILCIRNAIAHRSNHAVAKFQTNIIRGLTLLPQEKHPSAFLRSVFRASPVQTRYEYYVLEILRISKLVSIR